MGDYLKILLLGGDNRQIHLKNELEAAGHIVKHIYLSRDFENDFSNFEVVVFPFPTTRDGYTLNNTFCDEKIYLSFLEEKLTNQKVLCGNYTFTNIQSIDYAKNDALAILNAVPTAEGAIAAAIDNTDFTLWKSKCLVVGFGRIGKILANRLIGLGAEVCVSARKESDFAFIKALNYKVSNTYELSKVVNEYDIIFNTVEHPVIDANVLKNCKKDCLLIELASAPFGIDFNAAERLSLRTIKAQGLPGKIASQSAAKILSETILKMI